MTWSFTLNNLILEICQMIISYLPYLWRGGIPINAFNEGEDEKSRAPRSRVMAVRKEQATRYLQGTRSKYYCQGNSIDLVPGLE